LSVPVVESRAVNTLHTLGMVVLKEYPRQVASLLHAVQHPAAVVALATSADVPENRALVTAAHVGSRDTRADL